MKLLETGRMRLLGWLRRRIAALERIAALCTLVALTAFGCSWDALWGLDAPRPSLAPGDRFEVDPLCPQAIVDPSGLAVVPRIVTLTGRKQGSGFGAESVPVSVRRGACAHALNGGDGGSSRPAASASGDGGSENAFSCYAGAEVLDNSFADAIELVALEDRGCRLRSPSLLECTLNARGEAAFEVVAHLPDDEVIVGGYVPFCVVPLELERSESYKPQKQRELRVFPRLGASRIAFAVLELASDEIAAAIPPEGASCTSLFECNDRRARARFQAGIVSADLPASELRPSDFLPVRRDVALSVQLRTVRDAAGRDEAAFLSPSSSCAVPDAGVAAGSSLPLQIRATARDTDVFFLCASRFSSSHQLSIELAAAASMDAGASPEQINADAPASRSSTVMLPALAQGYVSEPSAAGVVVRTRACGGTESATDPAAVRRISGAHSVDTDGRLVIACATTDENDAGGTPQTAAAPDSGAVQACGAITLELTSGGTCRLDVAARSN